MKRFREILAWAVTIGLLGLLFWRTPVSEVVRLAGAVEPWTVGVGLALLTSIYAADSFAMWKTFGWFVARLPFRDLLLVRGAAYLLAIVHYAVGQGALVFFVHRTTGVALQRCVATVLLILGTNLLALLVLATAGLALAPEMPAALPAVVGAAYAGLAVYAVGIALRPRWLARRELFAVLLDAGWKGHLATVLVRAPHVAVLFAYTYFTLRAFGIEVPLGHAVATLPVVYFISALPISVQGLGTTQAAMIFFFARYAPGERAAQEAAVLSASLASQFLSVGFQALVGAICLRSSVVREVRKSAVPQAPPSVV